MSNQDHKTWDSLKAKILDFHREDQRLRRMNQSNSAMYMGNDDPPYKKKTPKPPPFKQNDKPRDDKICGFCKKPGHSISECRKKKTDSGGIMTLEFKDTYYSKEFAFNLISVPKLLENGHSVTMSQVFHGISIRNEETQTKKFVEREMPDLYMSDSEEESDYSDNESDKCKVCFEEAPKESKDQKRPYLRMKELYDFEDVKEKMILSDAVQQHLYVKTADINGAYLFAPIGKQTRNAPINMLNADPKKNVCFIPREKDGSIPINRLYAYADASNLDDYDTCRSTTGMLKTMKAAYISQ
ncbi:hypothetical protein T484DRAFT_1801499 [Baffinella frigidus]|nr:hypothetical protein T484DRAFT_1801499 [Cryptophyta sp. CCMP2293]